MGPRHSHLGRHKHEKTPFQIEWEQKLGEKFISKRNIRIEIYTKVAILTIPLGERNYHGWKDFYIRDFDNENLARISIIPEIRDHSKTLDDYNVKYIKDFPPGPIDLDKLEGGLKWGTCQIL